MRPVVIIYNAVLTHFFNAPDRLFLHVLESAILSILTAARSRAVGADRFGVAGAFTQTIDAELTYGLTEATDHHSYQFNRTIQTNWVFYRDALRPLLEP